MLNIIRCAVKITQLKRYKSHLASYPTCGLGTRLKSFHYTISGQLSSQPAFQQVNVPDPLFVAGYCKRSLALIVELGTRLGPTHLGGQRSEGGCSAELHEAVLLLVRERSQPGVPLAQPVTQGPPLRPRPLGVASLHYLAVEQNSIMVLKPLQYCHVHG